MTTTNSFVLGSYYHDADFWGGSNLKMGLGYYIGGGVSSQTADATTKRPAIDSYTLAFLAVYIRSNTASGAITTAFTSRKNNAAGNQSIPIASAVTGWQEDATHTDSYASSDTQNTACNATSSAPDCHITQMAGTIEASSPLSQFAWSCENQSSATFFDAHDYTPICGNHGFNGVTTEDHRSQVVMRASGTAKNLQAGISSASASATMVLRHNGGAGNQSITAVNNSNVQDSTHTDSIASGDTLDYQWNNAGSNMGVFWGGFDLAGTKSAHDVCQSADSNSGNENATVTTSDAFSSIAGLGGWGATEADTQSKVKYALTASKFRIDIQTNTESNSTSFQDRDNAAAGSQSLSVAAAATGSIEDATHSTSVASGDKINYKFVSNAGSGTINPNWTAMLLDDGSNTGSTTYNVSVSESMSLSDSPSALVTYNDTVSESMSLADTVTEVQTDQEAITEAMALSDSVSVATIFNVSVSEAMSLSDTVSGTVLSEDTHNIVVIYMNQIG